MTPLPLIIGFGGINAAGRSSFHHGFQRMVLDKLDATRRTECLQALAVLMNTRDEQALLDGTLIRRIEKSHFDVERVYTQRKMVVSPEGEFQTFVTRKKDLPQEIPANWRVQPLDSDRVTIQLYESSAILLPDHYPFPVRAAGQLPSGFEPGTTYPARQHPRGLEMATFAATDAVRSVGIPWQDILNRISPDKVSVYASAAMSQLDENGYGGMLRAGLMGKRTSSKQCPLGFPEMPADFINAYVLGNVGVTGAMMGACATFLYNLDKGIQDIQSGKALIAVVGTSDAPILPEVMEGYRVMGALAEDEALKKLDGISTDPDYRRACRPFSDNVGFTIGESSQYIVLCSDALALELGATIYGAAPAVFVHADGIKKSISAPGMGNYLTLGRAAHFAQQLGSDRQSLQRSFVLAHGTGTPQNRVTESHVLDSVAEAFGISDWPVAAIKAYLGHSIGSAGGDQVAAALGVFAQGILPGIITITHFADDVHRQHLSLSIDHRQYDEGHFEQAILNAKGFGGNNASAVMLSPQRSADLLTQRHGKHAWLDYQHRNESVHAQQQQYRDQVLREIPSSVYRYGEPVVDGHELKITREHIQIPGYNHPVDLATPNPY